MKKIVVFLNAVLAWTLCLTPSTAQIKPDASMPGENSIVRTDTLVDEITGGATRGGTLFHSFKEFNVNKGRSANFENPANINLILTRVTGGKLSNIDGILKVSGNADLFFMNPSGIVFGPNAALDLNGSFLATTGSSFVFEDGKNFSATTPQSAPPLKISIPLGIQFGNAVKEIIIQTPEKFNGFSVSRIRIKPGNTLSLLGGDLFIQNGTINAPNGSIELGSVDTDSFVDLNPISKGWSLGYSKVRNFKDININNGHIHNSNFDRQAGNNIRIHAKNLILQKNSGISTFTYNNGLGGEISINTKDSVRIFGGSIFSSSFDILIDKDYSTGSDIEIKTNSLSISDFGSITTNANSYGKGGSIRINSNNLTLNDGGNIHADTYDYGNSGDINIQVSNNVSISGKKEYISDNLGSQIYFNGGIFSTSHVSTGKTGNLSLTSKDIDISDGAGIVVHSEGNSSTGFLSIKGENLTLDNNANISIKGINNQLENLNIGIDNLLLMRNQSEISYKAEGLGIGGKVNIDAPMIIAFPNENSDIIIDAPKVDAAITGKEVLGLTKRSQPTNMSDIVIDSEDDRELVGEYGRTTKLKVSEFKGIPVQPQKIVKGCRPGQALGDGRFVYKRRGGIPPSPYEPESAPAIWQDLRPHPLTTTASLGSSNRSISNKKSRQKIKLQQESIPKQPDIVEAQGWTHNATGQIVLTAKTSKLLAHETEQPSAAC